MKTIVLIGVIFSSVCFESNAQSIKKDSALIKKIDTMFKDDQFWRMESIKISQKKPSKYDEKTIERQWALSDSINELKAKAIIKTYGYPGYNKMGSISDQFWAIVQHCDDDVSFQEHVLALMKIEVAYKNASKEKYAYLVDRVLVNKHQKQIYGTQIHFDTVTHKSAPFPLKYPKSVDKLREKMGLETLEAYLKNFN
jgi:hypothetical protein